VRQDRHVPIRRRHPKPDAEPTLGVAAVARRLGVATGTLRTWDRRYGLGPSDHDSGTRRRYTATDLARLTLMRRLMLEGVTAAEAAKAATGTPAGRLPGADQPLPAPLLRSARDRHAARAGGGRVVPTRAAGPAARGLARAAMSLDTDACTALLRASLSRSGAVATWDEVLQPVWAGLAEQADGAGAEVEHLLAESAETALRVASLVAGPARNLRPVLLAALEPAHRRLPIVVLSAALAERRVATRSFGTGFPVEALVPAVRRTGALAVVLWDDGGATADVAEAVHAAVRPRPQVVLAGPGWPPGRARPGVTVVPDLASAVAGVVELVSTGATDR
jgi:DNA-binding transcriptional MerR regulator